MTTVTASSSIESPQVYKVMNFQETQRLLKGDLVAKCYAAQRQRVYHNYLAEDVKDRGLLGCVAAKIQRIFQWLFFKPKEVSLKLNTLQATYFLLNHRIQQLKSASFQLQCLERVIQKGWDVSETIGKDLCFTIQKEYQEAVNNLKGCLETYYKCTLDDASVRTVLQCNLACKSF